MTDGDTSGVNRPAGLVLAGGQSSRMGAPKADLAYDATGLTFAQVAVRRLADAGCQPVCLALAAGQAVPIGLEACPVLRDPDGLTGPPAALWAAWACRPEADWLLLACDLPRVTRRCLAALLAAGQADPAAPAVAFIHPEDGQPEPLCALYRPAFRQPLVPGTAFSPRRHLSAPAVRKTPLPEGDETALNDCDRPEDYRAFRREQAEKFPDSCE
jgi:molybdopterin-guanine dinucleotide biosynthesis protein A